MNKIEEDENRKEDKIEEIEIFIQHLESVLPLDFESYKSDFRIKAICERYFEKIVEAVIDLAFIYIKEKELRMPENEEQTFDILKNTGIISEELCFNLKDAKSMRNFIIHRYGKINDNLVFHAVTEQLIPDVTKFLEALK